MENSTYPIAIVGEAWGEAEELSRIPFSGASGHCLTGMLEDAGIKRADCFLTNVFNFRPKPNNDIENLCGPKGAVSHDLPPLRQGKYILDQYLPELPRLKEELTAARPNVIIAAGATAAWALLGSGSIRRVRGNIAAGCGPAGISSKILPIYHPSAILRQWELRHLTVLDLMKAKRESAFPEIRRPFRKVYIEPSLADIRWFYETHAKQAPSICFDIETDPPNRQMTCIGFAVSPRLAFVIPFCRGKTIASGSYWPTKAEELEALDWVQRILALPCPKSAQNGAYDISWLWRFYGISVSNFADDTMLLHHALYPESEKGLGFLGSIYTNEASWKLMNRGNKGDEE